VPRAAELAELDDDELANRLRDYRRELLNMRFQIATSQLDNTARLATVRKDIARVKTLMREREIALAEGRELIAAVAHPRPVFTPEEPEEEEPGEIEGEAVDEAEPEEPELEEAEPEEPEDVDFFEDATTTVEPEEEEEEADPEDDADFEDEAELAEDEELEEDEEGEEDEDEGSEESKEVDR
jgi:large subunit ribosomal protein L29